MTRKNFKELAKALRDERPSTHWNGYKRIQWDFDVKAIARVCGASNPNFKQSKFFEDCGGLFAV